MGRQGVEDGGRRQGADDGVSYGCSVKVPSCDIIFVMMYMSMHGYLHALIENVEIKKDLLSHSNEPDNQCPLECTIHAGSQGSYEKGKSIVAQSRHLLLVEDERILIESEDKVNFIFLFSVGGQGWQLQLVRCQAKKYGSHGGPS